MTKPQDIGKNRTGAQASPMDSKKAIKSAEQGTPDSDRSVEPIAFYELRRELSSHADPVGTMPPPGSIKGAVKTGVEMLKGKSPMVLIDLLGARLAFERAGTRIYDAVLAKHAAAHVHEGGPEREDLELIRDQELRHAGLLTRCIESLGADPTAVTPTADIEGVASTGVIQVVSDPRVTLTEALSAVLVAELADNDAWVTLADLADRLGMDEMAADFREALVEEEDHLARVRAWLNAAITGQAGLEPTPPKERPEAPKPTP